MILTEKNSVESERVRLLEPTEYFQVGQGEDETQIYLGYDLFRALDDFSAKDSQKEQAGLLVGRTGQGDRGPFLIVEDAIELSVGDASTGGRFNQSGWQRARRIAKTRHPQRQVVGWFHSHLGTGLELTSEELELHARQFPEQGQVLYIVDPLKRDRNFYLRSGEHMAASSGFRIFGKETRSVVNPGLKSEVRSVKPDAQLQEKYLERSLEKIQRRLDRPGLSLKDFAILALLVTNLLLLLWRPTPPVTVDTSELEEGQLGISQQIGSLRGRLERLESHFGDLQILDEELALSEAEAAELEGRKPETSKRAQPKVGSKVQLHKVAAGDTLSSICAQYYDDSTPRMVRLLARHNKLKAPHYDIFPGDTLKIPSRSSLQ